MIHQSPAVDYDHSRNLHTINGPMTVFRNLWPQGLPSSLLDVGCGTGTWLRAALACGMTDVLGLDGASIPSERLLVADSHFAWRNLTQPVDLSRRFAAVICLEVAEHLATESADVLLDTLVRHSDYIVFSAACPGQRGQHHVNCQWPVWWQEKFNDRGYQCDDHIRWHLWDTKELEPWYRQNIFIAKRLSAPAPPEPRLMSVIHPDMLPHIETQRTSPPPEPNFSPLQHGSMPLRWYFTTLQTALLSKLGRWLGR